MFRKKMTDFLCTQIYDIPVKKLPSISELKLPPQNKNDYTKLLLEIFEGEKFKIDWTNQNIVDFLIKCHTKRTHLDYSLFTLVVNNLFNVGIDLGNVLDDNFLLFTKKGGN
jgi:hypothetical protein